MVAQCNNRTLEDLTMVTGDIERAMKLLLTFHDLELSRGLSDFHQNGSCDGLEIRDCTCDSTRADDMPPMSSEWASKLRVFPSGNPTDMLRHLVKPISSHERNMAALHECRKAVQLSSGTNIIAWPCALCCFLNISYDQVIAKVLVHIAKEIGALKESSSRAYRHKTFQVWLVAGFSNTVRLEELTFSFSTFPIKITKCLKCRCSLAGPSPRAWRLRWWLGVGRPVLDLGLATTESHNREETSEEANKDPPATERWAISRVSAYRSHESTSRSSSLISSPYKERMTQTRNTAIFNSRESTSSSTILSDDECSIPLIINRAATSLPVIGSEFSEIDSNRTLSYTDSDHTDSDHTVSCCSRRDDRSSSASYDLSTSGFESDFTPHTFET